MKLHYIHRMILSALILNAWTPVFGHNSYERGGCEYPASSDNIQKIATVTAGAIGVIGAVALTKYLINYKALRSLHKKRDLEHVLLGDMSNSAIKFYKWELKSWGTASSIEAQWQKVLRRFISLANNKGLTIEDDAGAIVANPTWQDVRKAISREKTEFWQDIKQLEQEHVLYADFMPDYFDAFGIQRDYKDACYYAPKDSKGCRASPQSPGSWTQAQEAFINNYMESAANKNIIFKMIKPNYRYAAQVYWQMYVLLQRLEQIERLFVEVEAGFAKASIRENPSEKIINYVFSGRE